MLKALTMVEVENRPICSKLKSDGVKPPARGVPSGLSENVEFEMLTVILAVTGVVTEKLKRVFDVSRLSNSTAVVDPNEMSIKEFCNRD